MLTLEQSVTKYYWMKMYRKLFRAIQQGQYTRVGTTGILRFTFGKRHRYYAITTKVNGVIRPIAWLYLWQKPKWKAWEVMQVYVFEKLRGKGLAKRLYSAAINQDNLIVASGKTQSRHSRALWSRFIRSRAFDIFAIDYWDLKTRSQVFWDVEQNEPWCEMDIYYAGRWEEQNRDVRLIATRKEK